MSLLAPQVVSRELRKAGYNPGWNRLREGIRVRQFMKHAVSVSADLDDEQERIAMADELAETLASLGYAVERSGHNRLIVTRPTTPGGFS